MALCTDVNPYEPHPPLSSSLFAGDLGAVAQTRACHARTRLRLGIPFELENNGRDPWLRQYYGRLRAAGKPGKIAVIAAMRKLLAAVWSVATTTDPSLRNYRQSPTASRVTNSV
jgi:hypothetical protein